ncbi:MAG: FtsQ-type POTRA domain-containing protein [Oscillospiraceae bacterium]
MGKSEELMKKRRDEAVKKSSAVRKRKRRKVRKSFISVLLILVLATLTALSLTVLFPTQIITVAGESVYSAEQIIDAAGIPQGDNLILLPSDEIEKRIERTLPYTDRVKLKKILPGTVKISAFGAVTAGCYQAEDGNYLVSDKGKVLEKVADVPEGIKFIKGLATQGQSAGEKLKVKSEEKQKISDALVSNSALSKIAINYIDVSDDINIIMLAENRLIVELGTAASLNEKIAHFISMLPKMDATSQGVINLKSWTEIKPEAYFKEEDISKYR